jgi:3-dehydroquinate synthetase
VGVPVQEVLEYIEADKKRRDGKLRWVLVGKAGVEVHEDVSSAVAGAAISTVLAGTTATASEAS